MIDKQTEMTQSEQLNYPRISEAIDYIRINFRRQPSLDQIAEKGHLSPFHFQRMFTEWAGVSPNIQAGGPPEGYMWGLTRKSAIIGWEAARINRNF